MTDVQILAFVVVPVVIVAGGWALAVWAGRADDRARGRTPAE